MSSYGIILPAFWDGPTGQAIHEAGGFRAQALAAYLFSNRHDNMLGLYQLPEEFILHSFPKFRRATLRETFAVLQQETFATRDETTEFVWVLEMARVRLLRQDGKPLNSDDNRAVGAKKLYQSLAPNPFLGPFWEKYGRALHLGPQRVVPPRPFPSPSKGASKGLRRGEQAPSKPVNRSEIRSGSVPVARRAPRLVAAARSREESRQVGEADEDHAFRQLCVVAHELADLGVAESDFVDALKERAAGLGLHYTGRLCQKAMDAELAARRKRA